MNHKSNNENSNNFTFLRISLFIVFFSALYILFQYLNIDFSNMTIYQIKDKIKSYGAWAPIVYMIIFQLRPFILLPATVAFAAAGIIWGWEGLFYIVIATSLCATWQFFIARFIMRRSVEKLVKGKLKKLNQSIDRNEFLAVFFVRLVPNVAFDIQNLAFGITRIRYGQYILGTFLGLLPGLVLLIYFGTSFISALKDPHHWWKMGLVVVVLIGAYLIQKYFRNIKFKKEVSHEYCNDDQYV